MRPLRLRRGTNVTVSPDDPRLTYDGTWIDQGDGAWKFCVGKCGVAMSFTGSQIEYWGFKESRGALMQAVIDSGPPQDFDGSKGATLNGARAEAALFSAQGLSPTQIHSIDVSLVTPGSEGGDYATFLGFVYVQEAPDAGPSIAATIASSALGPQQSASAPLQQQIPPAPNPIISAGSSQIPSGLPPPTSPAPTAAIDPQLPSPASSSTTTESGNSISPSSISQPISATAQTHTISKGAVVGAAFGGFLGALLLVFLAWAWYRSRRNARRRLSLDSYRDFYAGQNDGPGSQMPPGKRPDMNENPMSGWGNEASSATNLDSVVHAPSHQHDSPFGVYR